MVDIHAKPFAIGANFPASFSGLSTSAVNLLLWIHIPFQAQTILANWRFFFVPYVKCLGRPAKMASDTCRGYDKQRGIKFKSHGPSLLNGVCVHVGLGRKRIFVCSINTDLIHKTSI